MFQMSKRYSMFIAFPGVGYRQQEKKYREYLTPFVKEIGLLENCNFETTSISVLYIVLDKQGTEETLSFRKDFKSGEYRETKLKLNADNWEVVQFPKSENELSIEDVISLEITARENILNQIEKQINFSKFRYLNLKNRIKFKAKFFSHFLTTFFSFFDDFFLIF